jgi:hypothetical protein
VKRKTDLRKDFSWGWNVWNTCMEGMNEPVGTGEGKIEREK